MAYAAVTILMDTLRQNFLQPKPLFTLRSKTKVRSLYRNLCFLQTSLSENPYLGKFDEALKGLEAQTRDFSVEMRFQIEQLLVRLFHLGKAVKARRESAQKLLPILNRAIKYIETADSGHTCITLEEQIVHLMREDYMWPLSRVPVHIKKMLKSLCRELGFCCSETDDLSFGSMLEKLELHFNLPGMPVHIKKRVKSLCEKLGFHSSSNDEQSRDISMHTLVIEAKSLIIQDLRAYHLKKYRKQRIAARQRICLIFRLGNKFTAYIKKELLKVKNAPNQSENLQEHNAASPRDLEHNNLTVEPTIKMVGCIDEFSTIMDKLNRQSLEREIVSILGMGGIGKTTLAKRVYQDASVISHFDCRAWVTVSQEYNSRQVFQCLHDSLCSKKGEINEDTNKSSDQMVEEVYRSLKRQRYFIVIDDIWSKDVWNNLRIFFPDDYNGSRILMTTRIKDVAEHASPGSNFCHNMRFLDSQESWNLFHKKVSEKILFSLEFETIGRGIVEKCKGLPLAIIVAAGLLSKSKQTLNEWQHIAKNISTLLSRDHSDEQCASILTLSYTFLPLHLKPCFLSFGFFPEDSEIPIEEIVYFWVSEGFLKVVRSKSLEDVARESIQDLIDRNLVQVCSLNASGKTKKCQIHDVLRDLALIEAKKENLLYTHKDKVMFLRYKRTQPVNFSLKAQKMIVQSRTCSSNHLSPFDSFSSVLWLQKDITSLWLPSNLVFVSFKLLRGLLLSRIYVQDTKMLGQILGLVHLRYLSFEIGGDLDISYLPWFMMRNLQILKVDAEIECDETPSGIWELPQVRHLYLKSICSLVPPRSVQDSLETVYWLDFRSCTKELFTMTPNLMKLGIHNPRKTWGFKYFNWFESLASLYKLQELYIHDNIIASGLTIIHSTLENCLPNLKKLKLVNMKLEWTDMDVIGTLPNLEVLKLCDAVYGAKWEPANGKFLQLKHLLISGSDIQYWEATADHFPILERLTLYWCYKLEEIPCDFADIATLRLIELLPCSDSIIACAEHIREVQQDSGNDAFVLHFYDPIRQGLRKWSWENVDKERW